MAWLRAFRASMPASPTPSVDLIANARRGRARLYLDANALGALFLTEATSGPIKTLPTTTKSELVISDFGVGEVCAALLRRVRMGDLRDKAARRFLGAFDSWRAAVEQLATDRDTIAAAADLVRRFESKLRMPDAIHVALCEANGLILLTNDRLLERAADAIGVAAISSEV